MSSFFGSSLGLGFSGVFFSSVVDGLLSVKTLRNVHFCTTFRGRRCHCMLEKGRVWHAVCSLDKTIPCSSDL